MTVPAPRPSGRLFDLLEKPPDRLEPGWPQTREQRLFVFYLAIHGMTPHKAMVEAGYSKGYARNRCWSFRKRFMPAIGHLMIKKAEILEKRYEVTVDRILSEVACSALANWQAYLRQVEMPDGTVRDVGVPLHELDPREAAAVKSYEIREVEAKGGTVLDYRYTLHDKLDAISAIGKHLGMFSERLLLEIRSQKQRRHKRDLSHVPHEKLLELEAEIEATINRAKDEAIDAEFTEVKQG